MAPLLYLTWIKSSILSMLFQMYQEYQQWYQELSFHQNPVSRYGGYYYSLFISLILITFHFFIKVLNNINFIKSGSIITIEKLFICKSRSSQTSQGLPHFAPSVLWRRPSLVTEISGNKCTHTHSQTFVFATGISVISVTNFKAEVLLLLISLLS